MDCMENNFFFFTAQHRERKVLIIASDSIDSKVALRIGSFSSTVQSSITNLCVMFDQALYFDQHMFLPIKKHC